MAGGLLNIISVGNNNIFLTGNPSKTFFKVTYSKYSNFGLQKFRLDYDGSRDLRLTEPSTYQFTVKRYAELLMDTYLVLNLPDIFSPVYPPSVDTNEQWVPYGFRWIKDIGTQIIKEITITCGSITIQKYTGDYLGAVVDRDFTEEKKKLFNQMTGNVPELYDPANAFARDNSYPSVAYTSNTAGAEPSIRGRTLYIPINTWFTLNSACAFPLIALQYNELVINVTLRPIQELFQVRDVFDINYNFPYVQPDFNKAIFQMYRFLQTPPTPFIQVGDYKNTVSTWNADVHLISTYCFLSKEETKVFASQDQVYLVKDVFDYFFENITGSTRSKVNSNGMISNWMFYLQRNDVNLRNEWSNYTNWPYGNLPSNVVIAPNQPFLGTDLSYGMGVNPNFGNLYNSGITITGDFHAENQKEILETMGILLDGEYRENTQVNGIYNYIEKYTRTRGFAKEGLYCYNFCLDTSPYEYQPSGAINLSKFRNIQLETTTYVPPVDLINSAVNIICDAQGNPVGIKKTNYQLFEYNYNLVLYEERYNVLSFIGGNCGMLYSR
jgi:Major capsid protein N-terminus/Large eukaryotic DNA virus major capsid protein